MRLISQPYESLNQITLNSQSFIHNYRWFSRRNPQAAITPVLKANAYGHGLIPVARIIDTHIKPPFICVDSLHEAYQLTQAGIATPILLIGYTLPQNFARTRKPLHFSFTVFDQETFLSLITHQPHSQLHLKIDTGMNRLGLQPSAIPDFIRLLQAHHRTHLQGIYSHLSQADTSPRFTHKQIAVFKQVVAQFEAAGITFDYKHIAATAGASFITDPVFNLIRLGLGFYGYSPFSSRQQLGKLHRQHLHPALTLTSILAQTKTVPPHAQIGYGGTVTTTKTTHIGILPIGYADGLDRRLSNTGMFLGRIAMNMTTIKINKATMPHQAITIIDPKPNSSQSIYRYAAICHTIPYTILTGLNPTIRRIVI